MKTLKIGVAGLIGAGKSSLMQMLSAEGFLTLDADAEVHFLYANHRELRASLAHTFGADMLTPLGVNRAKLGSVVFGDVSQLRKLEALVHPLLFDHTVAKLAEMVAQTDRAAVFVEAALLGSWPHLLAQLDQVWEVQAPKSVRLERVIDRGATRVDSLAKIASQMSLPPLRHAQLHILDNSEDLAHLKVQMRQLLAQIT